MGVPVTQAAQVLSFNSELGGDEKSYDRLMPVSEADAQSPARPSISRIWLSQSKRSSTKVGGTQRSSGAGVQTSPPTHAQPATPPVPPPPVPAPPALPPEPALPPLPPAPADPPKVVPPLPPLALPPEPPPPVALPPVALPPLALPPVEVVPPEPPLPPLAISATQSPSSSQISLRPHSLSLRHVTQRCLAASQKRPSVQSLV